MLRGGIYRDELPRADRFTICLMYLLAFVGGAGITLGFLLYCGTRTARYAATSDLITGSFPTIGEFYRFITIAGALGGVVAMGLLFASRQKDQKEDQENSKTQNHFRRDGQ